MIAREWLSITLTKKDIQEKESLQAFKTLAALKFPAFFDAADEVHDCVELCALKGVNLQIPDGYVTDSDDALIIEGGGDRSDDFALSILELSGALECNVNIEYQYDDDDTHAEIEVKSGSLISYRRSELVEQDVSKFNKKSGN